MLLDSIRTQLDSLSKSERKVALAVLEAPSATVSQNITALAKSAQVSEPTVVRFCRTLGYDGWHEFKLKLAQGLALGLVADHLAVDRDPAGVLGLQVIDRAQQRGLPGPRRAHQDHDLPGLDVQGDAVEDLPARERLAHALQHDPSSRGHPVFDQAVRLLRAHSELPSVCSRVLFRSRASARSLASRARTRCQGVDGKVRTAPRATRRST